MNGVTQERIKSAWAALPRDCRSDPATEEQVIEFEQCFGTLPDDLRWFLTTCGGGTVGSEWVDDIHALAASHRKFLEESAHRGGWTMQGVCVVGWDGGGNPFGIHRDSGRVLVEDHDFGGIHELAESFEAFLVQGLRVDQREV